MAQQENLTIDQGSDYTQTFKFYTDSANTIPMDLSDATAAMKVRLEDYDGKVILDLDSTNELSIDEGASTITVNIPAAASSAIKAVNAGDDSIAGVYDLEVTVAGVITRVVQGTATINREATR